MTAQSKEYRNIESFLALVRPIEEKEKLKSSNEFNIYINAVESLSQEMLDKHDTSGLKKLSKVVELVDDVIRFPEQDGEDNRLAKLASSLKELEPTWFEQLITAIYRLFSRLNIHIQSAFDSMNDLNESKINFMSTQTTAKVASLIGLFANRTAVPNIPREDISFNQILQEDEDEDNQEQVDWANLGNK